MRARKATASAACGPLLSITHSARWPIAASVASARLGLPCLASPSSTCVAQTTGTPAASQIHRISSWISASRASPISKLWFTLTLVVGLLIFGAIFAINSSLHSYLILAFTRSERVTMDVGFYYMANATGRLAGTLLSGLTYQIGGLPMVLGTATVMVALAALTSGKLSQGAPHVAAS